MLMLDAIGSVITPALARQMMAKLADKFGPYLEDLDLWAEMHPAQIVQWENCGAEIQKIGFPPTFEYQRTFMGLPLESNQHLSPTVVLIRKNREIIAGIGRLGHTNWNVEGISA